MSEQNQVTDAFEPKDIDVDAAASSIFDQPATGPALITPIDILSPNQMIEASLKVSANFNDSIIIELWEKHRNTLVQEFNNRLPSKRLQVSRIAAEFINKKDNPDSTATFEVIRHCTGDVNFGQRMVEIIIPLTCIFDEIRNSFKLASVFSNTLDLRRLTSYVRMKMFELLNEAGYYPFFGMLETAKSESITLNFTIAPETFYAYKNSNTQ